MKSYINNAIIGNSRILSTLDQNSQFQRIYWPNIDNIQHIEKMLLGIYFPKISDTIHWLDNNNWTINQEYIDNTNIIKTTLVSNNYGIKIIYNDFAMINEDSIIRNIEIINISNIIKNVNFCAYCSNFSSPLNKCASFFDYDSDSVVYSKSSGYMFLSSNIECKQFQLTNNPLDACNRLFLYGVDDYSLGSEGAMIWELGEIQASQSIDINLYITFGMNLNETRKLCNNIKKMDYNSLFRETSEYWIDFIKKVKFYKINNKLIHSLFIRSILAIKLLCDDNGGIIASPEIDEEYKMSGGYGYCWSRDAVYITTALDKIGLTNISRKFYEWALLNQDDKGFWYQRYFANGNIAPGWGLQLDETASVILGMYYHYKITKDIEFLNRAQNSVIKATKYLVDNICEENNLPNLTYDLWEMVVGQHTYTSASVYSGLKAACQIGKITGIDNNLIETWSNISDKIKSAIDEYLWNEETQTFRKSINAKLNPWGTENEPSKDIIVNKKGYWRTFSEEDNRIDSSAIGLVVPFEVYDVNDKKIKSMIGVIEEKLFCKEVGGIFRFENDSYINGNPWVVNTIWLGLYYIKRGFFDEAMKILEWVCEHTTPLGLLSEQIDKYSGTPTWVIPLTWSHAMFINLVVDLIESGIIL